MDYRREIDGLRALAVIPVILFHAGFQTFSGGYVGVDVFFVISGYLITSLILAEQQENTFSLTHFYERRARRILPALFVVMFTCLPFAWLWLSPADMKGFSQSLVAVSLFASNVFFYLTSGYFDSAAELKPLLHTWSLAAEEQYYVLFPLFLLVTYKLGKHWIVALLALAALISLVAAQWGSQTHIPFTFFLLPTRGWEILVGAFIVFYFAKQSRTEHSQSIKQSLSFLGLLLITYAVFVFDKQTPFPSLYTLFPTIGAALIIVFATQRTFVGQVLGSKLFVGIGLISYSAYLWHQSLFAFARHRSLDEPGKWVFATLAIVSVVLAYFSWKYVETPFRDKQRFSRDQIFLYGALGSACFVAIGLVGHYSNGFPSRFDLAMQKLLAANMNVYEKQVKNCWESIVKNPSVESGCRIGALDGSPSFALIGDSAAGALLAVLDSRSMKAGIAGLSYTSRSCPPLQFGNPVKFKEGEKACVSIRNSFFNGLRGNAAIPKTIIVHARWAILMETRRFDNGEGGIESGDSWVWDIGGDYSSKAMEANIVHSIRSILDSGRNVILIYPVPEVGWDVPTRLSKVYRLNHSLNAGDGSTAYSTFVDRNRKAYEALDAIGEHENLVRIKPEAIFCDTYAKDRCVAQLNGVPLYYDNNHLSNAGALLVVDEVMKHIGNVVTPRSEIGG